MTAERPRRGRWVGALLVAAALVGVVALPTWVRASASTALTDGLDVVASGGRVAPQVPAAALVLLAAAGATALVGRAGRRVVAALTAAAGAVVATAGVAVLRDPAGAVRATVTDVTGVGAVVEPAATVAPTVAVVAGAGVAVLGLALLRARGDWRARSRRHDVPGASTAADGPAGPPDERDDWDALSRGDDPS